MRRVGGLSLLVSVALVVATCSGDDGDTAPAAPPPDPVVGDGDDAGPTDTGGPATGDDEIADSRPCAALGGLAATDDRIPAERTAPPRTVSDPRDPRVLVLTEVESFFHDSITDATAWFEELDAEGTLDVDVVDDSSGSFTADALEAVDVVVFVNTTGDVLDAEEQEALRDWVTAGGGFVGVHSAADSEYEWAWYGDELVGGWFTSHPPFVQDVELTVEDPDHPSVAHLPETFRFVDEYYNYDRHPRLTNDVVLSLDEATAVYGPSGDPVVGGLFTHGHDHPVAWTRQAGLGRSFYTNLGHAPETWADPRFRTHLLEGIRWTVGDGRWRRTVISDEVGQAVAVRITPSGHVFWIERSGLVRVWDPATAELHAVAELPVRVEGEGGLIGIEPAPDVADSGHLFLYFTRDAADGPGGPPENVLVRATLDAGCRLDTSEMVDLLVVPNDGPSHQGGDLRFHPDGSLLVATGDNTRNTEDDFAPLDPDEPTLDARRSAGDPTDLRGAILRVDVDGAPVDGNLADTGVDAAPEVLVTGVRNPYRLSIDPLDGAIWWGEIGPDAPADGERGPRGYDELNRVEGPADGGWPFCIADGAYASVGPDGAPGEPYDCRGTLVPRLAYDYTTVVDPDLGISVVPAIGERDAVILGRALMAGPFLTGDEGPAAPPEAGLVLHEFSRHRLLLAGLADDGTVATLEMIAPWIRVNAPVDVEIGPDGALYVLELGDWGDEVQFSEGVPRLSRLEHSRDGTFPVLSTATWADPVVDDATADPEALYQLNCAGCHGADGRGGTGPSYEGIAERLTEAEAIEIVTDGRDGMPGFGARLEADEIAVIVELVRGELTG